MLRGKSRRRQDNVAVKNIDVQHEVLNYDFSIQKLDGYILSEYATKFRQ